MLGTITIDLSNCHRIKHRVLAMSRINHELCAHPRTAKARAACRRTKVAQPRTSETLNRQPRPGETGPVLTRQGVSHRGCSHPQDAAAFAVCRNAYDDDQKNPKIVPIRASKSFHYLPLASSDVLMDISQDPRKKRRAAEKLEPHSSDDGADWRTHTRVTPVDLDLLLVAFSESDK